MHCGGCQVIGTRHESEAAAIAQWNRRALPASLTTVFNEWIAMVRVDGSSPAQVQPADFNELCQAVAEAVRG